MPTVIGIDPGLSGCVCTLNDAGVPLFYDMPVLETKKGKATKRELHLRELWTMLRHCQNGAIAYIEKQQAYPNQGSVSNFSIGAGYFAIKAFLVAADIPFEEVHPKTWQKAYAISGATKGLAYKVASQLFPMCELTTKRGRLLDGRCDALLIAEWGRRRMGGK
jgi:hypothetical protein